MSDVEEVIFLNSTANKSINCNKGDCKEFSILRFRIPKPGDYFMEVKFNLTQEVVDSLDGLGMRAQTINPDYSLLAIFSKTVLLVASIASSLFYYHDMRKVKSLPDPYIWEQKYLPYLSVALVMFFDPVNILNTYSPTVFT